ncbi:MAG: FlgD immunoglobulin-like domain containing protein [Candidatus Tenebribacter burtonii]|nr:FlgD immunoglobulin-like domain containing protein [Candidatus Tenebribacter burtonii]
MKKGIILLVVLLFTISAVYALPFTDDFTAGLVDWTVINGGDANWGVMYNSYAGGTLPEAWFSWNPAFSGVSYLTTPVLETTGLTVLDLEYKHFMDDYLGSGYSIGVATTSDGGVTWNIVNEIFPTGNVGPETVILNVTTPDVGSATFQLGFFFSGSTSQIDNYFIDDVSIIEGQPTSFPLPFTDDFSNGLDNWTVQGGGDANWGILYNSNAGGTSPEVDFNWNPTFSGTSYLTTPVLETTGLTVLDLEYKQYMWDYLGSGYSIGVATTNDGGVTWNIVNEVFPTGDIGPQTEMLSVQTPDVGSATFQLAFFFSGSTTQINHWFFDDVSLIEGQPMFLPPTNLFVDNMGYATWDAPGGTTIDTKRSIKADPLSDVLTGYNIYLDGVFVTYITDLFYQFTGLVNATTYLAEVTAVYDDPGESDPIDYQFTFNPGPLDPPSNLFVTESGYATWDAANGPAPVGLHTQLDFISNEGGISAQAFGDGYEEYDAEAADEFVVPAGETWIINQVVILGTGPSSPMELANICFYDDNAGMPGTLLFEYLDVASAFGEDGNIDCFIPDTQFTEGTYWMAAQGDIEYASYGQWFWRRQAAPTIGYEFYWRNPGDGFGSGCIDWVAASVHWPEPDNVDHNLSFGLYGSQTDAAGRTRIVTYNNNNSSVAISTKAATARDFNQIGLPVDSYKNGNDNTDNLLGYNIYLDGAYVTWTTGLYYPFTDLVHGTTYLAEVTALYDEGESVPVEYQFTYFEPSGSLPFTDDFSNGLDNWTVQGGGDANWGILYNNYAGGTSPEIDFNWNPMFNGLSYFKSPIFETTGLVVLDLEYKQYMWDYLGTGYSIGIATTSDGGVTWNIVDEVFPSGDIGPETASLSVQTPDVGSSTFQLAFFFSGSTTQINHWFFDDVSIAVDPFNPPNNFAAEVQDFNDVMVTWEAPNGDAIAVGDAAKHGKTKQNNLSRKGVKLPEIPIDNSRELLGFFVYRGGIEVFFGFASTYYFIDSGLDAGNYEYTIVAHYDEGESVPVGPVEVSIILPAPTGIEAESQDADIYVSWDAPTAARAFDSYILYRDGVVIANEISNDFYLDANVPAGTYEYELTALYDGGWESEMSDPVEIIHDPTNAGNILPLVTELHDNYPNPFNPETTIKFSLNTTERTLIEVYNIKGEKVKTLVDENLSAGQHSIIWNGTDDAGKSVSSGVYFYKIYATDYTSVKKMILLK